RVISQRQAAQQYPSAARESMASRATRKTAPQPVARPRRPAASSPRRRGAAGTLYWALPSISALLYAVAVEGRRQGTASARLPARFGLPRTAPDEPPIGNRRSWENQTPPSPAGR